MQYRYRQTMYYIEVLQVDDQELRCSLDRHSVDSGHIPLMNDLVDHYISLHLPRQPATATEVGV